MGARMASHLQNVPWITILLVLVMAGLDKISDDLGVRQAWRESCGFMPDKLVTYITHAFLHANPGHMTGNLIIFAPFGAFVEMSCGRVWYACSIMLTAVCGTALVAMAIPDYWPSESSWV